MSRMVETFKLCTLCCLILATFCFNQNFISSLCKFNEDKLNVSSISYATNIRVNRIETKFRIYVYTRRTELIG